MHVEREHDMAAQRHRGVGHEPVATHLRDESSNPGSELDTLGVELQRPEVLHLPLVVMKRFFIDVLLQVAKSLAKRAALRRLGLLGWRGRFSSRLRSLDGPGNS